MSSPTSPAPPRRDENIGDRLVAVAAATASFASIIVALRLYVRVKIVRAVGWNDWLILLSLILAIVSAGTVIHAMSQGLGRHVYYLTHDQKSGAEKYEAISSAFAIMSICFGQVSICISFLQILKGASWRTMKLVLHATIIVVSIVNSVVAVMTLVQCQPITKIWDPSVPGTCLDIDVEKNLAYVQGVVSAFADFELSLLPILVFRSLQMTKRKKLVLSVLMGIGFLTGIVAVARIGYIEMYARQGDMTFTSYTGFAILRVTTDGRRDISINLQIWAALERNVAIIVASIPWLHPLLRYVRTPRRFRSTGNQPRRGSAFQNEPDSQAICRSWDSQQARIRAARSTRHENRK